MMKNILHKKILYMVSLVGLLIIPTCAFAVHSAPQPMITKLWHGISEERETIKEITPKNLSLQLKIEKVDLYNNGNLFYAPILLNPGDLDQVYFEGRFLNKKDYPGGIDVLKIENGIVYERISEDLWQKKEIATKMVIWPSYYDSPPKGGGVYREWVVKGRINDQPFLIRGGHRVPLITSGVYFGFIVLAVLVTLLWIWVILLEKQNSLLVDERMK